MALLDSDISLINKYAYTFGHNFSFHRYIHGEPFLMDGTLYYFDGRILTINTNCLQESPNFTAHKTEIINSLMDKYQPKAVLFSGQHDDVTKGINKDDWKSFELRTMPILSRDVVLDLKKYYTDCVSGLDSTIQIAMKNDVKVINHGGLPLSAQHIRLMQQFLSDGKLDEVARLSCIILPAWLVSGQGQVFEVWHNTLLKGFLVLDVSLSSLAIVTALFFDRHITDTLDFLINNVINYCSERGFLKLSFGPSNSMKLFRYKRKWGNHWLSAANLNRFYYREGVVSDPKRYFWLLRTLGN